MKLLLKQLLQAAALVCLSVTSFAQVQISGKVTNSADGTPLSGVTVKVKTTRTATQTGRDGSFTISAPSASSQLVFSSVGFASQEAAASNGSVAVSLVQSTTQLTDLVVVAYGTRRKTDLTGAIVSVGPKEFQKGQITSSEQLLQGKVAGLEVTTGGGYAGGGSTIKIRGTASVTQGSYPLIVVDGVPVDGNGVAGSPNYLGTINPNDIESISVLKDAASTSLYGSRATAGVIIITTKKGSSGKTVFNFNTKYSVAKVEDFINVLTGDQIRDLVKSGGNATYINKLGTANTNWQKVIFQTANTSDNNLSAGGTIGKTKDFKLPYRASFGYLSQEGVLKTNKFERITGSLNLNPKMLNDHLAVNIAMKYSNTKTRFADAGAVGSAVSFDPTQPVYSNGKNWGGYYETLQADGTPFDLATRNPLALLELNKNVGHISRYIGNIQLDYKLPFFPDLHLQGNFGLDNAEGNGSSSTDSSAATSYKSLGYYKLYKEEKRNYLTDVSLFYTKDFKNIKSKIDILALHSYQTFKVTDFNYKTFNQAGTVDPQAPLPTSPFGTDENRLESYVGRLNYTFDDKYLITGSIRRDASSKFGKDYRSDYFPAIAVAWKLKNDFFKNVAAINELKIRASYGETGQQDGIGPYKYLPNYYYSSSTAQYQLGSNFYTFLRPTAYYSQLQWETAKSTNFGLDFGLFKNRISGTIDVYEKKSDNLLSTVPVAPGANFDINLLINVGNLTNRGVEAALNLNPIRRANFNWDLNVNGAYNKSKITNLLKVQDPSFKGITTSGISGGTGNNVGKHYVGYAPYTYFVYKQVYDANGKPLEGLYEDLNRDGVINDDDRYFFKKPAADFLFGFSTQFNIYKFYIGVAGHGQSGNYLYNNFNSNSGTLKSVQNPLGFVGNVSANYLETGFKTNQYLSDYYIENASFFKIDNINVGYDFGKVLNNRAALRINASAQNIHTFTKYKGADPENSGSSGVDNNIYPRPRTYSIGASLDF